MSQISPLSKRTFATAVSIPVSLMSVLVLMLITPASAKVPVNINSGNPAFPFPQFLPYTHPNGDTLHNLGTRGPDGVTHAEMERIARDAYQTMMNRADYATLRGVSRVGGANGTRYIEFHSLPRCSEGDGYAMLAAAMMADKVTFDGLWLHIHDFSMNKVTRYGDGSQAPAYNYSMLPGVYHGAGDNSAADGDFDIAMALMIAHMQWGDNMGINDSRGNPISYRDDFIKVARGLSDTVIFRVNGNLLSGSLGFDGYVKNGDSWSETSGWAGGASGAANLATIGMSGRVEQPGPQTLYVDYVAPAYFRQFADYLSRLDSARYAWNISQFRRAEASSDWLLGRLIAQNPRHIPIVGHANFTSGAEPAFTNFSDGEDFRAAWRTVLNYVWHGDPSYSWNHNTHQVVRGTSNTHQRDVGMRFSRFLWDRRQTPWNVTNETIIGTGGATWWGPSILKYYYSPTGQELTTFPLNWLHGTGSPSAVTAQDFDLMAEMFRQCELEMDVETPAPPGGTHVDRTPVYFHGFFRLLGMLTLTGNHHAPLNMTRQANMKVYLDVDKTYTFEGDTITYTIDYRNYGAEDASGVVITNRLHNDMLYVSSTGGGTYDMATNSVRWNIASVPGYKSSMGANPAQTMGTVALKVVIPFANLKRYENQVSISCANGTGWVSNEFPNKISSVMKRNGVDIARRALRGEFTVYRDTVNPGMEAMYTIDFENSAEAGWLNGGRQGVNFAYMQNTAARDNQHTFMMRIFHDAHEPYIDYGNYRISYFMHDNSYTGLGGQNGWNITTDIIADQTLGPLVTPRHEVMPAGQDEKGRWNQRMIVQVADPQTRATDTNWVTMAATSQHLITYYGDERRIARGGSAPYKAVWRLYSNYTERNWEGDWSFNLSAQGNTGDDDIRNWGFPISPDFTESYDPDYAGRPVTRLHRKLTNTPPARQVDNVLIEEWDGYTWRRVAGNGPVSGREVNNVKIVDTLPPGVTFLNFVGQPPLGVAPVMTRASDGRAVITWSIDRLLINERGRIQMLVRADTIPRGTAPVRLISRAHLSADRESQITIRTVLVVTNDELPPPPPRQTTMYKSTNRTSGYANGDTITYAIAYKQTHGSSEVSTSRSQWQGSNVNVSENGRTISMGNTTNMYFTPSHGTNVTITGTLNIAAYMEPITIFGRNSTGSSATNGVNIEFKQQWGGIEVTVTSNGSAVGEMETIAAPNEPQTLDFKIAFKDGEMLLWLGDTAATIPYQTYNVASQAGYAGVRYTSPGYDEGMSITNWAIFSDAAFDVTIRDTIPAGVRYVPNSATGRINTGALSTGSSATLTGSVSNNVITWPVVSGNTALGANDSLTVTWRGVVDSAQTINNMIVNTAYADLRSHPQNSIGAQVVTQVGTPIVITPPEGDVRATPAGCIFTGSISVTLTTNTAGGVIWYTTNGMAPDPEALPGITRRYTAGQSLVFDDNTTLRAAVYVDDWPAGEVSHTYELLRTVPVRSAMFYSDDGSGVAHGVKLVLQDGGGALVNQEAVRTHSNLITFEGAGMPSSIQSMRFDGDTITLVFGGSGIRPPTGARVVINLPDLPGNGTYTSAHGYLSEGIFNIADNVSITISYVPVRSAIFYDDVGDGLAHGVKLVLPDGRGADVNQDVVSNHRDLIRLTGMPAIPSIESIRFDGDTIMLQFRGAGVSPSDTARLVISAPTLGGGTQYTVADGYLSESAMAILDGVAPVITDAVYYPSINEGSGVHGDTLAVTFSKYPVLPNTEGAVSPFVLSYSNGTQTYVLELGYVRHSGNTITFSLISIGGPDPRDVPAAGDSVRIRVDGDHVLNIFAFAQRNPNNVAVPLRIIYPDLDYAVRVGPSPFRDRLGIWISVEPHVPAVFDALAPEVRIFDRLGNLVASFSGENEVKIRDGGRYEVMWDGYNGRGRRASSGTYLIHVTVTDQEGRKKTMRRRAYFIRDGGRD